MKKIIAFLLVVSMTAAIAVGGTLAYLTDRESEANVFTTGNVEIDLNEDFNQGAELIPGVTIDKKPTITNVGPNEAWVWATVAVPAKLDSVIAFDGQGDGWDWNTIAKTENVAIDGKTYNQYTILYNTSMLKDQVTSALFEKVTLNKAVDIDPNGQWHKVENGAATDLGWNNSDGSPVIYVSAYAIQKDQFTSVKDAYDAYNAQWTTDGGVNNGQEYGTPAKLVSTADDLVEALENNEDVILNNDIKIDPAGMSNAYGTTGINVKNGQTIHGNGHTIDIKGAGGTWDSGINTTGGTIKDLTVTGSFRGIFINHNSTHSEPVILENVTIDGTTYTISCDQGMNQTLTATKCTFNGWTSFAGTLGEAAFVDCSFGEGNGYAYCRPYAPTTFVGCAFEAGYQVDPRAAVTFENCTLDGVALTADNLAELVTGNIANATVK